MWLQRLAQGSAVQLLIDLEHLLRVHVALQGIGEIQGADEGDLPDEGDPGGAGAGAGAGEGDRGEGAEGGHEPLRGSWQL